MKPDPKKDTYNSHGLHGSSSQEGELAIERQWLRRCELDLGNFGFFFDKYYQKIVSYVYLKTGDQDLAQDVTSETFSRALDRVGRFQWRGFTVGAWLFRIARNVLASEYRTRNKMPEVELKPNDGQSEDLPSPQDELEDEELTRLLLECLEGLGTIKQDVFIYHYWMGLRTRQVGIVMDLPEGTVKTILRRGRGKLFHCLIKRGVDRGLSEKSLEKLRGCAAGKLGWRVVPGEGQSQGGDSQISPKVE